MIRFGYMPMLAGDSTDYYRASGVLEYIKHPEIEIKRITNQNIGWDDLIGLDVFLIQRPFNDFHVKLIKLAKDMGIRVILDFDDNLLQIPMHNASHKMYFDNMSNINECIFLADEIWVSTKAIKKEHTVYNKNIIVIPNAHNDYMFPVEKKRKFNTEANLAVYRGGASHSEDVYSKQDDIVNVINSFKDWEFRFIGNSFPAIAIRTGDNHTYTNPMTIIQFFNYLYDSNPNIMFFPLLDNPFNHAKSNISWLEATYAGAVLFTNTDLAEFSHGACIPLHKIMFVEQKDMERKNEMSWEYIKENLLLSKVNKLRIKSILQ